MLFLSDLTINIKPSKLYLKLAQVICILTLIAIYFSSHVLWFKCVSVITILVLFLQIRANPMPIEYTKLVYHQTYWLLQTPKNQTKKFQHINICLHGGFFLLLSLINERRAAYIVLFSDQVTSSQLRAIKLIGKAS